MSSRPLHCLLWAVAAAALAGCMTGCRRESAPAPFPARPGAGEFSVMTYNVNRFGLADRDNDGQEDDFKPDAEIAAVVELILRARPDILALQEIGDVQALAVLRERLREGGLDYAHAELLEGFSRQRNLALFSRFPVATSSPVTNLTYTIRDMNIPVQRGFQQVAITLPGGATLRLLHAHLKSRNFHEAGQTEMRRNEARLLGTLARRLQRVHPDGDLIVLGDFNDTESTATLRELIISNLIPLSLADQYGDDWTYFSRAEAAYKRSDYILINKQLQERYRPEASGVLRGSRAGIGSDHRPVVATFRVQD